MRAEQPKLDRSRGETIGLEQGIDKDKTKGKV